MKRYYFSRKEQASYLANSEEEAREYLANDYAGDGGDDFELDDVKEVDATWRDVT